jgi:hypothetical protein
MKTPLLRLLAALAAAAILAPARLAPAQEIQLASHAELSDLYARLAELESRIAASNVSGCGCTDAVGNGCGDCCDNYCGCPGVVAGAEFLWLKPFNSNTLFGDFNHEEAFRWWVGYQGAGGLGARVRGFGLGKTAANGDVVDISTIDFEIYDAIELGCHWDLIVGGGLRYTDATFDFGAGNGGGAEQIFGTGPLVTAELYRHISDRAVLYAIAHEAIVAGDGSLGQLVLTDDTMFISELQLGGQLHHEFNGGLLFARLGWEAQHYKDVADVGESVTLMGVAASLGFMR